MAISQRLAVGLTVINLVLLVVLVGQERAASAQSDGGVLRDRGLKLVDASGRVRAQFNVEPDGEAVFRMRDTSGTIRVKLGAGDNGSGLAVDRRNDGAGRPNHRPAIGRTGASHHHEHQLERCGR